MVQKLNPSFVARFAAYLKKLLTEKKTDGTISADDFHGKVTEALNSSVKEEYGIDPAEFRRGVAPVPEKECEDAQAARIFYGIMPYPDHRITYYNTQAKIGKAEPVIATQALADARLKYSNPDNNLLHNLRVVDWTSNTNMLLPDPTKGGKKKQMAVNFGPTSAVYCGECWICRTDVMSYTGKSYDWYDNDDNVVGQDDPGAEQIEGTTPCGDCEHVAAIMASYIAGMLKSGGFSKFYWASYYVACVECNRRKSNKIGVKLHATNGWEVDHSGVDAIVDAIFPVKGIVPHVSEYNPIRKALGVKYNELTDKTAFRNFIYANIASGTQTWCDAANVQMFKSKASSTMAVKFSEIMAAITKHLETATKNLQNMKTKTVSKLAKGKPPSGKKTPVKAETGTGFALAKPRPKPDPRPDPRPNPRPRGAKGGAPPDDEYTKEGGGDYIILPVPEAGTPVDEAGTPVDEDIDEDIDEDDYASHLEPIISTFMEWVIREGYIVELHRLYSEDPDIFEMLIIRLLHSMEEILISLHDIKEVVVPAIPAEPTAMVYEKEEVKQEPDAALPGPQTVTKEDAANLEQGSPPRKVPTQGSVQITPARVGSASQPSQESQNLDDESSYQPAKKAKTGSVQITPIKAPPQEAPRMVIDKIPSSVFGSIADSEERQALGDPDVATFMLDTGDKSRSGSTTIPDDSDPRKRSAETFTEKTPGARPETPLVEDHGGSRLNKRHSKNKSQTHNQKNRTKRVSYIKHKQTRKNQHSRKTK